MAADAHNQLAEKLGDLAFDLQAQTDTESTLRAIVEGSLDVVQGARWAGISMIHGRKVESRAPSDQLVSELDELQSSLDEGPCLSALREHHTVHIDDMGTDTRWPRFAQAAKERGLASLLSFQLFVHCENLGALNLYGGEPGVFGDDSVFIGEILAQHASVALAGDAQRSQLMAALGSRDIIGQAKGIFMHRRKVTALQAFEMLLKASQSTNIKLINVAQWVVDDHETGLNRPS